MKKGRIIKLTGGIYTVCDEFGGRKQLKPLGIFRYKNFKPKVGDIVEFDDNSILKVYPRENDLVRPAIANVDQALLVTSAKEPDFSFTLLDRFLVLIHQQAIDPVIIVTKIDLLDENKLDELNRKLAYYERFYPVIRVSNKKLFNIDAVTQIAKGKVNVLAGQTGAGKSSLLNAIDPNLELATDEISVALGRGKHTTRHVELIEFASGWIADTPGFSKLEFVDIDIYTLKDLYPDFRELSSNCRFNGCTHTHEPGCAVTEAYQGKLILPERYENYQKFYQEIKQTKPKY
ncbi:MAG: ribosome small subunit-dependent GTPase A [Bacilli bacterium]|nr:ribosome small subunit-dependent GTPase A [Bacilli bacterium]MBN2696964.1 ribosome small subunit-dependent GTPase A [Bacilli bacterium]